MGESTQIEPKEGAIERVWQDEDSRVGEILD